MSRLNVPDARDYAPPSIFRLFTKVSSTNSRVPSRFQFTSGLTSGSFFQESMTKIANFIKDEQERLQLEREQQEREGTMTSQ